MIKQIMIGYLIGTYLCILVLAIYEKIKFKTTWSIFFITFLLSPISYIFIMKETWFKKCVVKNVVQKT